MKLTQENRKLHRKFKWKVLLDVTVKFSSFLYSNEVEFYSEQLCCKKRVFSRINTIKLPVSYVQQEVGNKTMVLPASI